MIYRHEVRGRRTSTLLKVTIVWGIALSGVLFLDMAWWIAAVLLAFTLPALVDYIRDTCVWVEVWPSRLVWQSTLSDGDCSDIDHVRLDRRFDGGMKITLIHVGGTHTRLPPDVSPPIEAFQEALKDAGIAAQRHPFSVF